MLLTDGRSGDVWGVYTLLPGIHIYICCLEVEVYACWSSVSPASVLDADAVQLFLCASSVECRLSIAMILLLGLP